MHRPIVLALRGVLVVLFAGAVFVQTFIVPLLAIDLRELDPDSAHLRMPFLVIVVLGMLAVEVVLVCVWRLVTMVSRGTVFSARAFRFVDVVIGAFVAAAALLFALAVFMAPGEAVAPGIVLLVCLASAGMVGMALVVLVMRMLLAQAVARDEEAGQMQAELDAVI